ncbi:hypothetical protein [Roseibium salinum]|uniref:Uncharacterized protein n=1 Tax=Roseibium salinum TaxID=1604349 RepID=A0ABT3QYY9_9HYPH|nr:hypothetical protein [Roseibium sp. DSM 29163]MCX2722169.1 hypothetical protein [Roseibium sp. DSM 29163]
MKPFKKIAIAALAASVAGTALTAGLSASAQSGPADADGGNTLNSLQASVSRIWAGTADMMISARGTVAMEAGVTSNVFSSVSTPTTTA